MARKRGKRTPSPKPQTLRERLIERYRKTIAKLEAAEDLSDNDWRNGMLRHYREKLAKLEGNPPQ